MCSGGELLADFEAGTLDRPDVPDVVGACLTITVGGRWVVWASKLARPEGTRFRPMTNRPAYGADAVASCSSGMHPAPQPHCSCGFHALSRPPRAFAGLAPPFMADHIMALDVVLSGRVLAFAQDFGGALFRAECQKVVRLIPGGKPGPPPEPGGALAKLRHGVPKGAGPRRLRLPSGRPERVRLADDAGFCMAVPAGGHASD